MTKILRYAGRTLWTLLAAALTMAAASAARACTGIDFSLPVPGMEGGRSAFAGRTMEFGPDVASWKLLYMPRGADYQSCKIAMLNTCGKDNAGSPILGFHWPAKYAYVGFTPMRPIQDPLNHSRTLEFTLTELNDGINEKGLYCGGLYHMGSEVYSSVPYVYEQKNISDMDFVSWVLGQFSSVTELENKLADEQDPVLVRQFFVSLLGVPVTAKSSFPQLHFKVVDRTGAAAVIEFVDGKPKVFKSAGVITNNPTYDWQTTNLRNYVGLQVKNHESAQFTNAVYEKMSNGTGSIGLPGDFTSPSRFVRAMFFLNATLANNSIASPEEAILRSFRILNQFDIPEGSVVETKPENPDKVTTMEATSWTSMADLRNLRYYYHTMESRTIRMIDLGELMRRIPEGRDPVTIDTPPNEMIVNVTDQFKAR